MSQLRIQIENNCINTTEKFSFRTIALIESSHNDQKRQFDSDVVFQFGFAHCEGTLN